MNVMRNDRIIINGIACLDYMVLFAVAYFNGTFHYINKFFAFVR